MAATEEELIETIDWHTRRAKHELAKASALSKHPLREIAGQLKLPT